MLYIFPAAPRAKLRDANYGLGEHRGTTPTGIKICASGCMWSEFCPLNHCEKWCTILIFSLAMLCNVHRIAYDFKGSLDVDKWD